MQRAGGMAFQKESTVGAITHDGVLDYGRNWDDCVARTECLSKMSVEHREETGHTSIL